MMRDYFPGYYRPSETDFANLWWDAVFVFDTNVLCNLYRYTPTTRDTFLEVLTRLAPRIWLPHQVALEYHQQRLDRISDHQQPYRELSKLLRDHHKALTAFLEQQQKRHPASEAFRDLIAAVQQSLHTGQQQLTMLHEQHPDFLHDDPVLTHLTDLFGDTARIGPPYEEQRLKVVYREAEERIKAQIPPGYQDQKKEVPQRYGDILIWNQMLDYAQAHQQPLIFVTDDRKDDWWLQKAGKTLGPRPELRQEMQTVAHVDFYMYAPNPFITYALQLFEQPVDASMLDEVRTIHAAEEEDEREGTVQLQQAFAAYMRHQRAAHTINTQLFKALTNVPREIIQAWQRTIMEQAVSDLTPDRPVLDTTLPYPLIDTAGLLGRQREGDDEPDTEDTHNPDEHTEVD